jgi:hypothetical protein
MLTPLRRRSPIQVCGACLRPLSHGGPHAVIKCALCRA